MKLPDLGSTSPPALVPDIGPGQGQARDAALDAAAREGMRVEPPDPAAGSISSAQALEDVDAMLAAQRHARAAMVTSPGFPAVRNCRGTPGAPNLVPVLGGYQMCGGCVDCQESER